ncbi:MAG: SAM-dependent methyltransferase [Paludibacteraceae bacterium]|nr:SAM-dependent methyltransferase [Paludibacteraceae bacterium]
MTNHQSQIAALALQRSRYKHLSDDEWRWMLQQVEGRERTADKLPTFASISDWWYPIRLSCEQCSSEITARYKASLIANDQKLMADLTGGYGVDTYFLSEHFTHTDYIEQNAELCRIAAHNFSLQHLDISIQNTTAEAFLKTAGQYDLIYLDPARRDSHGGKVFRLEDCTPNVVELLPTLLSHLMPQGRIMLKLSPMLDITQALNALAISHRPLAFDVHVVAVKNEVKEVLLLSRQPSDISHQPAITAIDLAEPEKTFVFTREEEREANYQLPLTNYQFIYEPSASILKAGAYKLVAQRFGLQKLDVNTHLYTSDTLIENFPGRIWQIKSQITNHKLQIEHANVLTRNYPLSPEQLKKKLKLKDGGETYIIGCRVNGKSTLFTAQRVENIHSKS